MLLSKTVEISVISNNKKYLKLRGYDVSQKSVIIKISDLLKQSHVLVNVSCDICGIEKSIPYNSYNKGLNNGGYYACNNKLCSNEKRKRTNLIKFNSEWASQNDNIKNKVKNTNIERYGVDTNLKIEKVVDKRKNTFINNKKNIRDKIKNTNIERYGYESPLSNDKIRDKISNTNIERHGVDNPMKLNKFIDKGKITKKKKYGDENYNNREKSILTNIEKYGVDNYTQTDEYIKKTKKTNLEKYNKDSYSKTDEFKNRVVKTNLEKYGVDNYTKTDDYIEKTKKTNLEKYGVEWSIQSSDIRNKLTNTNIEKYGVKNYIELDFVKYNAKKSHFEKTKKYAIETYQKLLPNDYNIIDYNYGEFIIKHKDHEVIMQLKLVYDRLKYSSNSELCLHCNPLNSQSSSSGENEISDWLESLNIKIEKSERTILDNNLELDIYIPDYNVGIEFNGLYWHSELFKNKYYHLNKTKECKNKNIRLLHIFEDDWIHRKDVCKSIILNSINKIENKIYARKCEIKEVKSNTCKDFLDKNHIQGYSRCKYRLGLYYNNELISVMTFGWRKTNNKKEFELIRFCNKINTNVIGGASKLFKSFLNNHKYDNMISYADISLFTGDLYEKLGFNFKYLTNPNYFWVVGSRKFHRFVFNKKNLVKNGFDPNMTESDIMNKRGYYKIWSCGQMRFEWNRNN